MRITYKLMLGFVFVSLFVIVSGIFGIMYTNAINSRLNVVTEITTPTSKAVSDMIVSLWKNNKIMQQYSTEQDLNKLDELKAEFDLLAQQFKEAQQKVSKLIKEKTVVANLDTAVKKHEEFTEFASRMMSAHKSALEEKNREEREKYASLTKALLKQMEDNVGEAVKVLDEISERAAIINKKANEESYEALKNTRVVLTITTILSLIFAIILGFFLSRSIINPINDLSTAAQKISTGKFDVEVKEIKTSDEINQLSATFNQMARSLRDMLEESPRLKKYLNIAPSAEKTLSTEPKYELEERSSYLIKEETSKTAFDIFLDRVAHGFQGLCITRTNPDLIKEKYGLEKTAIVWLSEVKDKKYLATSDIAALTKIINEFITKSQKSIVLLDRIDYLIAKHGFQNVLRFLINVNDKIMISSSMMIIPVDPKLVSAKELPFLEKELRELPRPRAQTIPEELVRIMKFIDNKKSLGQIVTFKDISREFSITAPTTQKKVLELYNRGLVRVIKQGRNKLLELTKDAQNMIP